MMYKIFSQPKLLDTFILIGEYTNWEVLYNLNNKVLDMSLKENNLDYKTNVQAKFTGFNSLIDDKNLNTFIQENNVFVEKIFKNQTSYHLESAWGNVYRKKGDHAKLHQHSSCDLFCGIIYFNNSGPGTFFPEYNLTVEEKPGRFVYFHPHVLHEVKPFEYEYNNPRITVAFNVNSKRTWDK
jgi:hypothetical protein